MNTQIDIDQLVKNDSTAISNKEGLSPLFELAQVVSMGKEEPTKEAVEKICLGIEIEKFTDEQLSTFLAFIHYSKISTEKLLKKLAKFALQLRSTKDVAKRGILYRFILERSSNSIPFKILFEDAQLRNEAPWLWVDCMSYQNPAEAFERIGCLLANGNSFKQLLFRLPSFLKRFGQNMLNEAIIKWYPNLESKEDRAKLEKWADRLDIKIGLSIPAEHLLDNVNLFQTLLIS